MICRDLRTFWKNFYLYILHRKYFILYWIEFAICNNTQKRLICRDNSKYAPAKTFVAIFTLAGRLPTFATLSQAQKLNQTSASKSWPNFSFEDLTKFSFKISRSNFSLRILTKIQLQNTVIGQFDTQDNLTPRRQAGQFDTMRASRTIWHRKQFNTTENLTPQTIFDTRDNLTPQTSSSILHRVYT